MRNEIELNRRRFLKGIGACMALPAFESLLAGKLLAAAAAPQKAVTATGAPLRTAFVYRPQEFGPDRTVERPAPGSFDLVVNDFVELADQLGV